MVFSQRAYVEQRNTLYLFIYLLKALAGSASRRVPGPVKPPWWRNNSAKRSHYLPPERGCATTAARVRRVCVLTHDRHVVLDQEQSFLAALHQHRQSVGVLLSAQRHPVYAQHSVSGLQRALSAEETITSFPAP